MVDASDASANKERRLSLSDEDVHLLDFPSAPPITSGGFCELYVAVYRPNDLKLAMRRLKVDFPTEDMLRRFRREAGMWSTLQHANILPFFGTMNINHRIYIVSPWMSMGDLLAFVQTRIRLIKEGKDLSDSSVHLVYSHFNEAKAIQEIAAGLDYLHSIDIVHGDMKAKNVLLDNQGSAQICDFGFTKTLDHTATSTELKGVGSIRWQSPELLQNSSKSRESDVYAFGMTISEILTGDYPFPHFKEPTSVMFAVMLRGERPTFQPLSRLGVDFEPLWQLATRCWETKAEKRPSIKEVLAKLNPLESSFDVLSIGDSTPKPTSARGIHSDRSTLQPHLSPHLGMHDLTPPDLFAQPLHAQSPMTLHPQVLVNSTRSSSITRLPCSLLQFIFLSVYESYSRQHKADRFVMAVSAVCQSWRAAAITTPVLWSVIAFTGLPPFERQILQIERSGTVGLTLQVDMDYGIKHINQIIKLVRPHVARWRSLTMTPPLKAKSYRLFFDELRHERAPMLEIMNVLNNSGRNRGWRFRPFGCEAPRLTQLSVSGCRLKEGSALFNHLTELTIMDDDSQTSSSPLSTHDLLTALAQCAPTIRILNCNVPNCRRLPLPFPMHLPIVLPHLQFMALYRHRFPHELPSWGIVEIYSSVVAPRLEGHFFEPPVLEHLVSRDAFPFTGLLSLTIEHGDIHVLEANDGIPQSVYMRVLSDLPLLQDLTIDCITRFDYNMLISLCRQLQTFTVRVARLGRRIQHRHRVKEMIEARQDLAKEGGTKDSIECVILEGLLLRGEEISWLEGHLREFIYNPEWNNHALPVPLSP